MDFGYSIYILLFLKISIVHVIYQTCEKKEGLSIRNDFGLTIGVTSINVKRTLILQTNFVIRCEIDEMIQHQCLSGKWIF